MKRRVRLPCARALIAASKASSSLAMLAAMRRASSLVSKFVAVILEIDVGQRVAVVILDDEAGVVRLIGWVHGAGKRRGDDMERLYQGAANCWGRRGAFYGRGRSPLSRIAPTRPGSSPIALSRSLTRRASGTSRRAAAPDRRARSRVLFQCDKRYT
jgi:hypothetical protein